jgi:hypothetical protein
MPTSISPLSWSPEWWLLLLVLLVGLAIFHLITKELPPDWRDEALPRPGTPLEIARDHYAAGRISREQWDALRRVLAEPAQPAGEPTS